MKLVFKKILDLNIDKGYVVAQKLRNFKMTCFQIIHFFFKISFTNIQYNYQACVACVGHLVDEAYFNKTIALNQPNKF